MASGGIVTGSTLAMLGEGGRPEVVKPLSSLDDRPVVNIIINNNSKAAQVSDVRQDPSGDIVVAVDDITAQAYSRRGSLYRAVNTAAATKPIRR